jgi:branched-chain amino acid transport system permease protein
MQDGMKNAQKGTTWFVVLFMVVAAFTVQSPYVLSILILICFYAILSQSWDFLFGYAGITSFCHAAFIGIGAYTSALLALNYGLSPWLGMLAGGGFAALTSLLVGLSTLRIKIGAFLATTTIAFNEVVRIIIQDPLRGITRGVMGLTGIPRFPPIQIGPIQITFGIADKDSLLLVATAIFALVSLVLYKLSNSKTGLTLRAIREDQDAAEALGINITRHKVAAFAISAFIAGVAGGFYAH